jgi:hypothetical protein
MKLEQGAMSGVGIGSKCRYLSLRLRYFRPGNGLAVLSAQGKSLDERGAGRLAGFGGRKEQLL